MFHQLTAKACDIPAATSLRSVVAPPLPRGVGSTVGFAMVAAVLMALGAVGANAQDTADVSVPAFVTFTVSDITVSTTAAPTSATVSFSNAMLTPGQKLRISVMADTVDFSPPSGNAIPAANVTWTIGGAVGGTGSAGTMSSGSFTQVYESVADPLSGSVDVNFSLAAIAGTIRSGNHTLTVRWQFESVL